MRILQLCSAREIGGGEKHLADLANSLSRRGHDVYAALIPSSPLRPELSALPEQNILEIPMRNSLNVVSAMKLGRFVRENQIEIIHAHVARDYPLAALAAGLAPGSHLILTRHVLFPLTKIHTLTLRRVARVIAVSQAVADGLRAQNIFEPDKIVVIHNGVDLNRFVQSREAVPYDQSRPRMKLRVGTIGHLAPIKGHDDLIRAAAIICAERDDIEFVIAGEDKSSSGEHRRNLESLIEELGLGEQVRLVGWLEHVEPLLRTLDLFVSAAHSEPFGLAIIEAMASGVPVIATMSEGAREIVEADKTGKLVPVADVEAIAKAISGLLADKSECDRLRIGAQRAVAARFGLERMVEATEDVYRQAR